jgi:tRNA G37 N-methylase Trm5
MGVKEKLTEILVKETSFPKELIQFIPNGFQELEHRAILNLHSEIIPYAKLIGESIPKILPQIIAVWNRGGAIQGAFREPTGMTHLWGDPTTEIIVKEHGIQYKFDFTKIMFAKGNVNERKLVPEKVQPGDIIFDMFAGIGYFSLGMAKTRKPKCIYSIEWNPASFEYLKQNIILNDVQDKIVPIYGDCKIKVLELVEQGIHANRIIMGLLPAPKDAIPSALNGIHETGTIVLYEGIEPKESTELFNEFSEIANSKGYSTQLLERRIVKSYSPNRYHIVVEIFVKKN